MSTASADPFPTDLIPSLRAAGLVVSENPAIRPLSGGVSCDILLIEEGNRRIVVKRAGIPLPLKIQFPINVFV